MLYVTSLCSNKKKIGDAVVELAELGFKNIELTGGTVFYDALEKDIVDIQKEYNLNYLIHNYFPPPEQDFVLNLASAKQPIKKAGKALVKKAVELTRQFGNSLYTMHPGFRHELLPEMKDKFFIKNCSKTNLREDFYKAVSFLVEEIIPERFSIAIENLGIKTAEDKFSFLCDGEDMKHFLEYFKDKRNVGLLLDLGHFNLAAAILRFDRDRVLEEIVDKYWRKIFAFHVSENDGYVDMHSVNENDSWQLKFIIRHKNVFKDVPIIFEWQGCAAKQTYKRFKRIEQILE